MLHARRSSIGIILLVASAFLHAQEGNASPKRIALVIGNGNFPGSAQLATPSQDAIAISASLEGLGFAVTTLIDADLASMAKAGRAFLDASRRSELRLFYYSGFGVQAGGSNWLLPAGSEDKPSWSARTDAFSADTMLSGLAAAGSGTNVFILDAGRDSPFATRSGSRGLARMSADNSILAFSSAPGAVGFAPGKDDKGRSAFADAILAELAIKGKSMQEILSAGAERAGAATGGKQAPWIWSSAPALIYLVEPQAASQDILAKKVEAETSVKQLEARVGDLKARIALEKEATQRSILEAELKAQADLLAAKKRELEDVKAENQRQVATAEARNEETALLASLASDRSSREEPIIKLAELRRWEIQALVDGADGIESYLKAIESTAAARVDIAKQYETALAASKAALGDAFDKRIKAVQSWIQYPWESDAVFRSRTSSERIRISSERQARINAFDKDAAGQTQKLLQPFDEVAARALAGLEASKTGYGKDDVKVTIGDYDRESSSFAITIASLEPELPFKATISYSIASEDSDELRKRYLQIEGWRQEKTLTGEIDVSFAAVEGKGYADIVDAFRIKVAEADGERLLYEERPLSPVACFTKSSDRARPVPVSSWLSAVGYGTVISVDGGPSKRNRLFVINPKAGDHVVRAESDDGSFMEQRATIKDGGHALVEFRFGRITLHWLAAGSTVSVRGLAKLSGSERPKGEDSSALASSDNARYFVQKEDSAFRTPLLPEGSYNVAVKGPYDYAANIDLPAYGEIEVPGYADSVAARMSSDLSRMTKAVESKRARTKIGFIALEIGAVGAAGAVATYLLGADAASDLRSATGTPEAEEARFRYDFYNIAFPISAILGAIGLGASPALLLPGSNPDKMQKSIDALDAQLKALAKPSSPRIDE